MPSLKSTFALLAVSGSIVFGAGQALGHAQLMHAEPGANATVSAPKSIVLHFNEALEAKLSSFKLTNTDGEPVAVAPAATLDAKGLSVNLTSPLPPGLYTINWAVAGHDGHPMKGNYSFTVK